jgi:hypothetical protein
MQVLDAEAAEAEAEQWSAKLEYDRKIEELSRRALLASARPAFSASALPTGEVVQITPTEIVLRQDGVVSTFSGSFE